MSSGRGASTAIKVLGAARVLGIWLLLGIFARPSVAQTWRAPEISFLEPNHFEVSKQLNASLVWLQMGIGADLYSTPDFQFGLEGKEWSRLRYLSGFRFPVETADYFFGAYSGYWLHKNYFRFRISHISSHWVDGTQNEVVSGSSSKFSREFATLELARRYTFREVSLRSVIGVRYTFHQVQKLEPTISFPITLETRFADGRLGFDLSTATGPSIPTYCATALFLQETKWSELILRLGYSYGYPRAGAELRGPKEKLVELGVSISPQ